jgi:RNA polymerase sigma-70 factor (ECF subfamily)
MTVDQLIKAARKNQQTAQAELFFKYKSIWFSICMRYLKNRSDAEDVLQNALINIFGKMKSYDSKRGTFRAWSCRVVVNECLMFFRLRNRSFAQEDMAETQGIMDQSESPVERLNAKELSQMISELPDGYRAVFNMYVIDGFNHKEIAEELGISEGTSKSQLFKARNYLKQILEVLI